MTIAHGLARARWPVRGDRREGVTMTRKSKSTTPTGLDMGPAAYRYTPGDRREYTWDGVSEYAAVRSLAVDPSTGRVTLAGTGDAVYMAGCARTASAFMEHIDRWRAARQPATAP